MALRAHALRCCSVCAMRGIVEAQTLIAHTAANWPTGLGGTRSSMGILGFEAACRIHANLGTSVEMVGCSLLMWVHLERQTKRILLLVSPKAQTLTHGVASGFSTLRPTQRRRMT